MEKYARVYYTQNLLKLQTISHMVRYTLSDRANQIRVQELIRNRKLNQPGLNKLSTRDVKIDQALLDRIIKTW